MGTPRSCCTAIRTLWARYNSPCKGWSVKVAVKSPVVTHPIYSSKSAQGNLAPCVEGTEHRCWTTHQSTGARAKDTAGWVGPSVVCATTGGEAFGGTIRSCQLHNPKDIGRSHIGINLIERAGISFFVVSPRNWDNSADKVRLGNVNCIWPLDRIFLHPTGSSVGKIPCVVGTARCLLAFWATIWSTYLHIG